jgi:hypothetical protein
MMHHLSWVATQRYGYRFPQAKHTAASAQAPVIFIKKRANPKCKVKRTLAPDRVFVQRKL